MATQNTFSPTASFGVAGGGWHVYSDSACTNVVTVTQTNNSTTLLTLGNDGVPKSFKTPSQLAAPASPSASVVGTTGSTHYTYKVTTLSSVGQSTPTSSFGVTTGKSSLTTTNYVTLSWTAVAGATGYVVFKKTSSTYKFQQKVTTNAAKDTGQTLGASTPPTVNSTGITTVYFRLDDSSVLKVTTSGVVTLLKSTGGTAVTVAFRAHSPSI